MMKNITITLLAVATFCTVSSCKKEAAKTTSTYHLTATTSSGSFTALSPTINAAGSTGSSFKIQGRSATETIELWFIAFPGTTGTFPLDGVHSGGIYFSSPAATVTDAIYGSVTFTSVSPEVIGTFSFTRADSAHVSGSFDITVAP